MAQGLAKLKNTNRSAVSNKRKAIKNKKIVRKGPKQAKPRNSNKPSFIAELETTKAINRKNEATLAAKAVSSGAQFSLSDISEKGKKEMNKQLKVREKRENKATSVADKVRQQLKKLGKDV